jgi:hypothetical protein
VRILFADYELDTDRRELRRGSELIAEMPIMRSGELEHYLEAFRRAGLE